MADDTPPAPVLRRPSGLFPQPAVADRPTSRHGGGSAHRLGQAPLDKKLPDLPQYLVPAPLFVCKSFASSPVTDESIDESTQESTDEPKDEPTDESTDEPTAELRAEEAAHLDEFEFGFKQKSRSHFSTWSNDSCPVLDDEMVQSPTFSTLTSDDGECDSPRRLSNRHSMIVASESTKHTPTIFEDERIHLEEGAPIACLSPTPPQLGDLHISTFGSDFFDLDVHCGDTSPNRQAACYGLGVYSLPEDDTTSKTTITNTSLQDASFGVQRESSVSQLTELMDDFAFLGDAVI